MSSEQLNYVIAYLLDDGRLSVYSYGSQLQFGNLRQAKGLLDYVRHTDPAKPWKIYKLNPEEVK